MPKQRDREFEFKVRLVVMDFDCSMEAVSAILGVQPSETWAKGQPVAPQATNTHHEDGWMLRSPVDPNSTSFEEALRALLLLFPDKTAFVRLPPGSRVQLTCTIYAYVDRPFVALPAALLSVLGQIGASLDVDIYDLSNEDQ